MRELTELRIWAAGGMEEQALLPLDLDNKEEVRVASMSRREPASSIRMFIRMKSKLTGERPLTAK